jgi:lipopolysaccharide export system protein LptA
MTIFSKHLHVLAAVAIQSVLMGHAWAEKADRDKPLNAQADALKYDDLKQTSVFTGNVIITKGTIAMRGGRVDVRQDSQGFQYATITSNGNVQAYFKQKRENGVDEWIEGLADTIEYDGKADKVKLIKNANLKRLKGASLNDEIVGGLVVYDNTTDVYTVDGGAGQGGSGGRVSAILSPKPTTVAAPAATPQGTLRQSTSLGGEKK